MKTYSALKIKLLISSISILLFSSSAFAAEKTPTPEEANKSALFLTLKEQDKTFFDHAFNQCDMTYLDRAIAKDFRMYHDTGGAQDRAQFLANVKKNICADPTKKPIRKVDEASLQVFPLYKEGVLYGAIQSGVHHFYIREPNKEDHLTGTANFTHIYLLENGQWIMKEALSFNHKAE